MGLGFPARHMDMHVNTNADKNLHYLRNMSLLRVSMLRVNVLVCVRVCVRARVFCVRVCVRARVCVLE